MKSLDLCVELAELTDFTFVEIEGDWATGIPPDGSDRIPLPRWDSSPAIAGILIEFATKRGLRIVLDSDERNASFSCHFEPVGWIENHLYGFSPDIPVSVVNNFLRRRTFAEAVANALYVALCTRRGIPPELTGFL